MLLFCMVVCGYYYGYILWEELLNEKLNMEKLIINPTGILCLEYLVSALHAGKIGSHRNSIYPGRPNSRPLCMLNDAKSIPKRAPGFLNKWFVTWNFVIHKIRTRSVGSTISYMWYPRNIYNHWYFIIFQHKEIVTCTSIYKKSSKGWREVMLSLSMLWIHTARAELQLQLS